MSDNDAKVGDTFPMHGIFIGLEREVMNSCDDLDGHVHTYHLANGGSMFGEQ